MTEWFEEWFGEAYLALYPHRDDADAARLVSLIQRTVGWRPGCRALDVACGAGRHAAALQDAGAQVFGLDLSTALLRRAREATSAPLIRADMRALPVRIGSMDLTVNLFTSFGYFESDAEHAAALAEMASTVRHGGWMVLDFLNAAKVRAELVPTGTTTLAGQPVTITRALTDGDRFVTKTIRTSDGRTFNERVRLFSDTALRRMLDQAGISVLHQFGSYDGAPAAPDAPRVVLMGRAA